MRGLHSVVDSKPELKKDNGSCSLIKTNEETANEIATCFQNMFTTDVEDDRDAGIKEAESKLSKWNDADIEFTKYSTVSHTKSSLKSKAT